MATNITPGGSGAGSSRARVGASGPASGAPAGDDVIGSDGAGPSERAVLAGAGAPAPNAVAAAAAPTHTNEEKEKAG